MKGILTQLRSQTILNFT